MFANLEKKWKVGLEAGCGGRKSAHKSPTLPSLDLPMGSKSMAGAGQNPVSRLMIEYVFLI